MCVVVQVESKKRKQEKVQLLQLVRHHRWQWAGWHSSELWCDSTFSLNRSHRGKTMFFIFLYSIYFLGRQILIFMETVEEFT